MNTGYMKLLRPVVRLELLRLLAELLEKREGAPKEFYELLDSAMCDRVHPHEIAIVRATVTGQQVSELNRAFPTYVITDDGAALTVSIEPGGNRVVYYRTAGEWSVWAQWHGNRLHTVEDGTIGRELFPCSHEEYMRSNGLTPKTSESCDPNESTF